MYHIKVGDQVRFLGIKHANGRLAEYAEENKHIGEIGRVKGVMYGYQYPVVCHFPNLILESFRWSEVGPVVISTTKLEDYL